MAPECLKQVSLKPFNTFHVEALADRLILLKSTLDITEYSRIRQDHKEFILGGGSNVLFVSDYQGTILKPDIKGIEIIDQDRDSVWVQINAGEPWDDVVSFAVNQGWWGLENLSAIPGSAGAAPVQNIGAYGKELSEVVTEVTGYDLIRKQWQTFENTECDFGYRTSRFKLPQNELFLITSFRVMLSKHPRPCLSYPDLRECRDTSLAAIRRTVIDIRAKKLPDPHEWGNAGSFFKNPVVSGDQLEELRSKHADIPHFPVATEPQRVKLPAAWLIEKCGWKGARLGRAGVSPNHALILLNLGNATGRDILDLAVRIQSSVHSTFGIDLEPEIQIVDQETHQSPKSENIKRHHVS